MRKTIAIAAVIAALAPGAAFASSGTEPQRVDVAYQALTEGRTGDAVAKLDESSAVESGDPAALINLGTAYARQGRVAEARSMFRAAIESNIRYDLELADGSWVDSRKAARMALQLLDKKGDIAMR